MRKRYYQINNYKTEVERRAAANLQIKEINTLLKNGYYVRKVKTQVPAIKEEQKKELDIFSIKKAFEQILSIEQRKVRKKSYQKGTSIVSIFTKWIHPKLYLHQISKRDMIEYLDYLLLERNITPVTRNVIRGEIWRVG